MHAVRKSKKLRKAPPEDARLIESVPTGTDLQVVQEDISINSLLRLAVNKLEGEGAEAVVAAIEKLVELEDRVDRRNAEKEFNNALAEFQSECPQILKTKSTPGASSAGGKFGFAYAPLDVVERTIKPHLYHRGFSYYWDGETTLMADKFFRKETCHLLHRNGHQITSSLSAPVTKEIGSMNDVQRFGTVQAYLKRYTLLAVLGVPTSDIDTDAVSPETIDEKEIKILKGKAKTKGADEKRFLEYMGVKDFAEIRKVDLSKAALALDMYQKKEPAEKTDKPPKEDKEEKPKAKPTEPNLNILREKAYVLLKQAADKKIVNRDKWEPIINNAKSVKDLDTLISNLTAFVDEAGKDGKLQL